jgi:hypothetical protein
MDKIKSQAAFVKLPSIEASIDKNPHDILPHVNKLGKI